jgi:hypothetical protein
MWADLGTQWVYLGTFKSSTPDVKVGDCFNHGHCTPAGFIPLTQDPANVTIIMPTQAQPTSPSSPINTASLLFVVQGYSWSNNEGSFGLFPTPDPFSDTTAYGNIECQCIRFKNNKVPGPRIHCSMIENLPPDCSPSLNTNQFGALSTTASSFV